MVSGLGDARVTARGCALLLVRSLLVRLLVLSATCYAPRILARDARVMGSVRGGLQHSECAARERECSASLVEMRVQRSVAQSGRERGCVAAPVRGARGTRSVVARVLSYVSELCS